ncbi:trp operon repressor [Pasteurella atlantica]|uniref:Trp operon repressor n=3 Tax=Pasteurellaceae TaxID=712 RepID=A0ACC6HJ22_9PAST|nr:trp operon repressor [Pasteurella atlantica]MBR0573229.1 trp operon repressor [Pasteurella atlantica]MDP8034309.1 trp operon repressor [Pasteurella atlantica]MDP8036220.1 trp operon repressor [Pasteurella atlantica]MDP8038170.1 trp operon repressor [Pasteurella atlantica]MDP8039155.1 trp operon repressor [Pasteurella atlantica]
MKSLQNPRDKKEWQQFISLLEQAALENKAEELLSMLLTADERSSLGLRVQIVRLLLDQDRSQREIQQILNTSIATVTRGSNMLKTIEPEMLEWINKKLNDSR